MAAKKADVVTFGNFKGGTGKSTTNSLLGYVLSEMGFKVLICDFDPQGNVTDLFIQTKSRYEETEEQAVIQKTLYRGIIENDIASTIINIKPNLDLIPNYIDFAEYPYLLEELFENVKLEQGMFASRKKRTAHFSEMLEELKSDYDFIFIDTPPTMSVITDSAFYASDYILLILQTQEWSLAGAEKFVPYLQRLMDAYDMDLQILGVLPVILKKGGLVDEAILDLAREKFGNENIFGTNVMAMERIKRFDMLGIGNDDMHDKRVLDIYEEIAEEFLARLAKEKEMSEV